MALLTVENLSIHFHSRDGSTVAVESLSFSLERGEVLGIVGESGSGKSVSCYSLLGLIPCPPGKVESGKAFFKGKDLLALNERQLRKVRGNQIAMIFQEPMTSLNPYMTIGQQLVEAILLHENISKAEAKIKAIDALSKVGISNPETRVHNYPFEFSGGMRQRVMIAMALLNQPDILIADEPTTALDVTVQAQILDLIKKLQAEYGMAVIFISHDLAVVSQMANNVVVMEKGKMVESGTVHQVFHSPLHEYTKKLLSAIPKSAKRVGKQYHDETPILLDVKNLSTSFHSFSGFFRKRITSSLKAVDNISLSIKRGEILGLVGESGSGKSTLGRSIMRLIEPDSGQVLLNGIELTSMSRKDLRAARADFQMIFQDTYASLNPRMTVFDALAESISMVGLEEGADMLSVVNELMDEVGLERKMIRKYPHEFSGGQRQRIAIARALAMKPKLIVADEPVSALDVTIQAQILDLLIELTRKYQLSMLFISHDLAVVRYICDNVAVMKQGQLVERGEAEHIFNHPQHPYTQSLLDAIPLFLKS